METVAQRGRPRKVLDADTGKPSVPDVHSIDGGERVDSAGSDKTQDVAGTEQAPSVRGLNMTHDELTQKIEALNKQGNPVTQVYCPLDGEFIFTTKGAAVMHKSEEWFYLLSDGNKVTL
jgi:hypothetical protein